MIKKSSQREAIIKVLRSTSSHPDAKWIWEQVKKEIPGIGIATVYRNLRQLTKIGEVWEIGLYDGTTHYDANTNLHYHFVCHQCGKIIDLDEPVDAEIERRIAEKTGLMVTRHNLELGGLCFECKKSQTM